MNIRWSHVVFEANTMPNESIDRILRQSLSLGLPIGFAERVAARAINGGAEGWDFLLRFSPRVGMAVAVVATILFLLTLSSGGPSMLEAVQDYAGVDSFLSVP